MKSWIRMGIAHAENHVPVKCFSGPGLGGKYCCSLNKCVRSVFALVGKALQTRDSLVQIIRGKLAHHHFLFAHQWMALAIGLEVDERLFQHGGLAVAKGFYRGPRGDYGCFQSFSRAGSQREQAAKSKLSSQERSYGINSNRKLLGLSREDTKLPYPRVYMHLRAN